MQMPNASERTSSSTIAKSLASEQPGDAAATNTATPGPPGTLEDPMGKEGWDGLNARKADKIPAKLDKLQKAIIKETGFGVKTADVIRIVVDEAMERRKLK